MLITPDGTGNFFRITSPPSSYYGTNRFYSSHGAYRSYASAQLRLLERKHVALGRTPRYPRPVILKRLIQFYKFVDRLESSRSDSGRLPDGILTSPTTYLRNTTPAAVVGYRILNSARNHVRKHYKDTPEQWKNSGALDSLLTQLMGDLLHQLSSVPSTSTVSTFLQSKIVVAEIPEPDSPPRAQRTGHTPGTRGAFGSTSQPGNQLPTRSVPKKKVDYNKIALDEQIVVRLLLDAKTPLSEEALTAQLSAALKEHPRRARQIIWKMVWNQLLEQDENGAFTLNE